MPIPFGVILHNDTKHVGSAKRGGPGGVAQIDTNLTIQGLAGVGRDQFIGIANGSGSRVASWANDTSNHLYLGINTTRGSGSLRCADTSKGLLMLDLDRASGILTVYIAAATAGAPTLVKVGSIGLGLTVGHSDGTLLDIETFEETVQVTAGNTVGFGVNDAYPHDYFVLGSSYEVIQAPGGGAVTWDGGDQSDLDRFAAVQPVALGTKGNQSDGNGGDGSPHTPTATQQIRITTNANVTGASFRVKVIVWRMHLNDPI